jgi:hypothetical protein
MPRRLRIEFDEAIHHVMARRRVRQKIIRDETDRRPATFLVVSRVIEKKCATPSGWLTKDDGENGRRDRQAARVAVDLRRRGAATATRVGHAGTVGRSSPVHFSVRILTTDITDSADKRIRVECVMRSDGDG